MPSTITIRRRSLVAGLAVLLTATAAASTTATWAATQVFSDVPADHQFADEIEWMYDTGVSTGYGDGTYRPTEPVSRQAMAAFLQRAFSLRDDVDVHAADDFAVVGTTSWVAVATATVEVPAGTRADVVASFTGASVCVDPVSSLYCLVQITVDGTPMAPGEVHLDSTGGTGVNDVYESHAVQAVTTDVGPGTHTVTVQARRSDATLDAYILWERTLVAEAVLRPAA